MGGEAFGRVVKGSGGGGWRSWLVGDYERRRGQGLGTIVQFRRLVSTSRESTGGGGDIQPDGHWKQLA